MRAPARREGPPDIGVLGAFLGLAILGVFFVASASYAVAGRNLGSPYYYIVRHMVYVVAAVCVFVFALRARPDRWEALAVPAFAVSIVLALLVFVPGLGVTANGATRWIRLGPITIQPSEFLKIGLILAMSWWLSTGRGDPRKLWPGYTVALGMLGVSALVVELQHDLGTGLVLVLVGIGLMFAAGAHLRHIGATIALMLCAVVALVIRQPYRMERVWAWLDPWAHKNDEAYQVVQSFYAFGEGAWHGTGLGQGQAKYFIPAPHTDFVFATVAEETGIIGSLAIAGLFFLLGYCGARISRRSRTVFGRLVALGVVLYLCGQAALNIAVVTGLVPCTGVPLPLISYGGSSLIAAAIGSAILFSLSRSAVRASQEYHDEDHGNGRRHRRTHLPRTGSGVSPSRSRSRSPASVRR